MRRVDLRARDQRRQVLRRGSAVQHRRVDSREIRELLRGRRLEIGRHREQVVVTRRIQERDFRAALRRLAHAMRQHRRFAAQVRADHQQRVELIDVGDREPTQARRRRIGILVADIRLAQAMIDVGRTQRTRQAAQQIEFFDGAELRSPGSRDPAPAAFNPFAAVSSATSQLTRFHSPAFAHHGCLEAVGAVDALVAVAIAVGDPGLVDGFVGTRHHAHQPAAQHVPEDVGADAVVRRHQRGLRHFPGARAIAERLGIERAHRAQVDDVARELVFDGALDVGADLHVLAAARGAELLDAGDLGGEAHAARAVNAARHVGGHQRTQVLVLDHALAFVEARHVAAEAHGQILQLALATLVADRAIERMVDEQEFHGRLLGPDGLRATW